MIAVLTLQAAKQNFILGCNVGRTIIYGPESKKNSPSLSIGFMTMHGILNVREEKPLKIASWQAVNLCSPSITRPSFRSGWGDWNLIIFSKKNPSLRFHTWKWKLGRSFTNKPIKANELLHLLDKLRSTSINDELQVTQCFATYSWKKYFNITYNDFVCAVHRYQKHQQMW